MNQVLFEPGQVEGTVYTPQSQKLDVELLKDDFFLFKGYQNGSLCSVYLFGTGFTSDALSDTTLFIRPGLGPENTDI